MLNNVKNKLKSNKGFTMQDLIIACFVIIAFVGIITTLLYNVYKQKVEIELMSKMTIYSIEILEDIDKISYEEFKNKTVEDYRKQFSIPNGFNLEISISDYGAGNTNVEDLIKIVNLKISYELNGNLNEYKVEKLKIKEI